MIILSLTMFTLGVLAFTDAIFNYGNMFRMLFSALLIFMSVWVFMKTRDLNDLERQQIVSSDGHDENSTQSDVELTQRLENDREKLEKVHN